MDAVDQAHLSIGEVLSLLKEEFPDVTISKIRFLESQGLIEPERTPSGYRRFHDPDIERLRWVLRQQRDHFLPLKVIKAKLDEGGPPEQPTLWEPSGDPPATDPRHSSASQDGPAVSTPTQQLPGDAPAASTPDSAGARASGVPGDGERPDPGAWLAALRTDAGEDRPSPRAAGPTPTSTSTTHSVSNASTERISLDELLTRSGADHDHVRALVDFGLLRPVIVGGEELFGADSVEISALAVRFVALGVGVRNLRSYRLAADREIGVIEALLLPLLKQRNPDARTRALDTADQLADLGADLRAALVRQSLAPHLH